jgi:hypothetical protein
MNEDFKLTIELVPSSLWWMNPRKSMKRTQWDTLRKQIYQQYNNTCGICGAPGVRLSCHERWVYSFVDAIGMQKFIAGQFRSGINEDILKAALIHYSMRTSEHEQNDRIYAPLSPEFKIQLTQLEPGQTLLQYPALRTSVFARFLRPFVMSGARAWQELSPPIEDRPVADCIFERLCRLDTEHSPLQSEVHRFVNEFILDGGMESKKNIQTDLINRLRDIEISYAGSASKQTRSPWDEFSEIVLAGYRRQQTPPSIKTPTNFLEKETEW